MPSVSWQLAEPLGVGPQVPNPTPASFALLQTPLQQSVPLLQMSPVCTQNDEAEHFPPLHRPEQQSLLVAQVLLSVEQVVLSGAHLPLAQVPLQQSASLAQTWLSDVHAGRLQMPLVHAPEQQSAAMAHTAPRLRQFMLPPVPLVVLLLVLVLVPPAVPLMVLVVLPPAVPVPLPPVLVVPAVLVLSLPHPAANEAASVVEAKIAKAIRARDFMSIILQARARSHNRKGPRQRCSHANTRVGDGWGGM
jgi:hypothetical protein